MVPRFFDSDCTVFARLPAVNGDPPVERDLQIEMVPSDDPRLRFTLVASFRGFGGACIAVGDRRDSSPDRSEEHVLKRFWDLSIWGAFVVSLALLSCGDPPEKKSGQDVTLDPGGAMTDFGGLTWQEACLQIKLSVCTWFVECAMRSADLQECLDEPGLNCEQDTPCEGNYDRENLLLCLSDVEGLTCDDNSRSALEFESCESICEPSSVEEEGERRDSVGR
jgi:hypothetical protein